MTMPNFLLIGAAKAGTTALYDYLKQHPQVYMSPLKETNFFALAGDPLDFRGPGDDRTINHWSKTTLEGYQIEYTWVDGEKAIGEASPLYLYSPKAPPCIREYISDAKLIAILRHPIERAYSAYLHMLRDGRETLTDFRQALEAEDARIRDHWEHIWHYKRMGLYGEQLQRYYDIFDPDQIKVYLYDDFCSDPGKVMRDLFFFLGVDEDFNPDMSSKPNVSGHVAAGKNRIPPELRAELTEFYRQDLLHLEALTGLDVSRWLSDSPCPAYAPPPEVTSAIAG